MLYPLKFDPILKSVIWGGNEICTFKNITPQQDGIGESWEVSHVKNNISIIANGILKGQSLDDLINEYGEQLLGKAVLQRFDKKFPLLIKFIDARDDLSIQVHPDDSMAKERHHSFGKTEMWYVINATPEAKLYSGFQKQLTSEKYKESVEDNTFTDYLARYTVKPGDVFFLPAGRVHAIGAGCFIAEIQQTSDITYRIYDYNRKDAQGNSRELHTELAKDAIDYKIYEEGYKTSYQPNPNHIVPLASCPYFTTNLFEGADTISRKMDSVDSFIIYICMEGKLTLTDTNGSSIDMKQGETVLVPASCNSTITLSPSGNCKVLETYIG